jgi:hypothetical protein
LCAGPRNFASPPDSAAVTLSLDPIPPPRDLSFDARS